MYSPKSKWHQQDAYMGDGHACPSTMKITDDNSLFPILNFRVKNNVIPTNQTD